MPYEQLGNLLRRMRVKAVDGAMIHMQEM